MNPSYAILLCGNSGVGKSTLSNVFGASFNSGFSLGEGLTKNVSTYLKVLDNGDRVLLIDAPGMYEASLVNTRNNAKEIRKALGYNVPYKIGFVVASNAGRWLPQDIALIDKVVGAVTSIDETPIEYLLIINQIQDVHWLYYSDENILNAMVTKLRDATKTKPTFSATLCCPSVANPEKNAILQEILMNAFKIALPYCLKIIRKLEAHPDEPRMYQVILLSVLYTVVSAIQCTTSNDE